MLRITRQGFYGFVFRLEIFGFPLLTLQRTRTREHFFFGTHRIFVRNLPSVFKLADIENAALYSRNESILRALPNKGFRILYVVDSLDTTGGTERRLHSQLRHLKKEQTKDGLPIVPIVLTQSSQYAPLNQEFAVLRMNFHAPHFAEDFIELVAREHIDLVEFQFKKERYAYDIDLKAVKRRCRIGCFMHNLAREPKRSNRAFYSQFHYRLSSQRTWDGFFSRVPNWIESCNPLWHYSSQRKALYIGRSDKSKVPSLLRFIKVCKENGISFEIACPLPVSRHWTRALKKEKIPSTSFIGAIDTLSFLKEHASDYLFVAGIGQVPVEAASFGIPAFLPSSRKKDSDGVFLTNEAVQFFHEWNFVINECPRANHLCNIREFFDETFAMERGQISSKFDVVDELCRLRLKKNVMAQYRRLAGF